MKPLRIFVSSPGDVGEERVLAQQIIERIKAEFAAHIDIEPIFWEHEPLRATASFQEQILRPSQTDIVIFILWSRLGTRLPATIIRPDGSRYSSGTEFEFEDAANGHREHGTPDMLVYRKTAEPVAVLDKTVIERLAQKEALDQFITRWFQSGDGSFTAAFHSFANPAQFEDLLERHLRKLLESRLPKYAADQAGEPGPPIWTQGSPFRGLESFGAEHAPVFFGRTQAISELLNALRKQASDGRPFVLVLGMSGVGKSSLVKAGLLPNLTRPGVIEGVGLWRRAILRPSDAAGNLLESLAVALMSDGALPELRANVGEPAQLAEMLRESPKAVAPLIKAMLQVAAEQVQIAEKLTAKPESRLALLIDQMEEIFTLPQVNAVDRKAFTTALGVLTRSEQVWVIATMRSDFYTRCPEVPELLELKAGAGQYDLRPPSPAEVSQMIRQPARMAGLRFEEDRATEERLDDTLRDAAVSDPEALPLLEFTLSELYRMRTPDGLLTLAAYRELGGVEGALGTRAEEVFTALPASVRASLPAVMSSLVTVGLGHATSVTRKRARLSAVTATVEGKQLVDAFVAARFLVTDRDDDNNPVVQVAHEALLRRWPRLEQWIADNVQALKARAQVAVESALWQSENESPDFLLREGKLLAAARDMLLHSRGDLTEIESKFITASLAEADRQRRRRRLLNWATAAATVLLAASVLFYLYGWVWTHTDYYEHFTRIKEIPVGIKNISRTIARGRSATYKFYRKGRFGPVLRVEAVNGYDLPTTSNTMGSWISSADSDDSGDDACAWTYLYDMNGDIKEEIGYNQQNVPVFRFNFEHREDPHSNIYLARYSNPEGLPTSRAPSGASYVELTVDSQGNDIKERFLDVTGKPSPNASGDYGFQSKDFDANGRAWQTINLGPDGRPMADKDGYAIEKDRYDSSGAELETRYFNAQGEPVRHKNGYWRGQATYDEKFGNMVRKQYLDADSRPIAFKEGYSAIVYKYDDHGNEVEREYLDVTNKPVKTTWGYARIKRAYDSMGRQVEEAYLGPDGKPATSSDDGSHKVARTYDKDGRVSKRTYWGIDGKPILQDCAQITYKYDSAGHVVERTCWDADDNAVPFKGASYATSKTIYNDLGKVAEQSYFGVDGAPAPGPDGCPKITHDFDPRGNRIEYVCLNANGQRTTDKNGTMRTTWAYDDRGNETGWESFGPNGQPVLYQGCCASMKMTYVGGNETEIAFFDTNGALIINKNRGFAKARFRYNAANNRIEEDYFGVDGQPILASVEGFAKKTSKFGEHAKETEIAYFATDGKTLVVNPNVGYARVANSYDSRGNLTEQAFFGPDGRLVVPPQEGYARVAQRYDDRDESLEVAYFGPANLPLTHPKLGYAKRVNQFDSKGNVTETQFFDVEGKLLMNPQNGYARGQATFDDRGNQTKFVYFGPDNRPIIHAKDGCAQITTKFDQQNRGIERACFETGGKPFYSSKLGYAKEEASYDERGNQTSIAFFGADSQPMIRAEEGCARVESKYDQQDHLIDDTCFGVDQKPLLSSRWGFTRTVKSYSARGDLIEQSYFGPDGKLISPPQFGYARVTILRDSRGHPLETAYFGPDGRPVISPSDGFAKIVSKYNAAGKAIELAFFGIDDKPCVVPRFGYAKLKLAYDSRRNETEDSYFDPDDKPTLALGGYASVSYTYDTNGKRQTAIYRDTTGIEVKTYTTIFDVVPGSQSERLGLQKGDIIVSYDNKPIDNFSTLIALVSAPGDQPRELIILRNGHTLKLHAQPGKLGVNLQQMTRERADLLHQPNK